jgi:hypothetical protein
MIFPVFVLVAGTFCCFCGPLAFIAQESYRPITQADLPGVDISLFDLATRASGKTAAVGSLIIAKFDDRNRGILVAFDMMSLRNQVCHNISSRGSDSARTGLRDLGWLCA